MFESLGWTQLHHAVYHANISQLSELLKQIDINKTDKFNRTPLTIAAAQNNLEITQYLLKNGADINLGFPLHYACEKGHEEIVSHLLQNGALVNLVKDNNYALNIASSNGHLEIVKKLIENGANVNAKHLNQATALHNACTSGSSELLTLLINAGCDINAKDKYDSTPLNMCLLHRTNQPELVENLLENGARIDILDCQKMNCLYNCENPETLRLLIKFGGDVNACDIRNETPLFAAAEMEYTECAKIFLDNQADPNIVASGGWTALHLACKYGDSDLVEELLKFNANVNAASAQNVLPIHYAAKEGHLHIVQLLLDNGSLSDIPIIDIPDVNTWSYYLKADDGLTPLDLAKLNKHEDLVKVLQKHQKCVNNNSKWNTDILVAVRSNNLQVVEKVYSANLNERDLMGWTLLHHSVFCGLYEMSAKLIEKGLSVNSLDKFERTPLSIASAKNDTRLMSLLLDKGADVNLGLAVHFAVKNNCLEALSELVKFDCNVNIKNKTLSESTALIEAASECYSGIVKILLENNADPNITNKHEQTALHSACTFNDLESVHLLLQYGANINVVDNCEDTPLSCAVTNSNVEIVKVLIENGADIHWKDNCQWTPLHRAYSSEEITSELVKAGADINYYNDNVESPLFLAASSNSKVVKILLENGADINFITYDGWTPLHEASFHGNLEIVKQLLNYGLDVNVASAENILPIYLASISGHCEIVQELLEHGSYLDPQILDFGAVRCDKICFPLRQTYNIVGGNTPIIGAASEGHLEVVKLLRSKGASVSSV